MRTIPQRELRNDSAAILSEVEAGRTITVTRNGHPAAVLVPPSLDPVERARRSGLVIPAGERTRLADLPRVTADGAIEDVLHDLRDR